MTDIRVTRFARSTRYAVLVPNDQQFKFRVIKRVARTTTKAQAVQLETSSLITLRRWGIQTGKRWASKRAKIPLNPCKREER